MKRREALKSVLATAAAGVGSASLMPLKAEEGQAVEEPRQPPPTNKLMESVLRYLAAWCERDPRRRRELVAQTWTEDGTYIDHARQGNSHDSIAAVIGKAQIPYPGYRVALASSIECHHQYVRFSWVAGGAPDSPLYLKGTDIVVLAADCRFKAVIGFVDAAPMIVTPA